MRCAWKELLSVLPPRLRQSVDEHSRILQELRLRRDQPIELITMTGSRWLTETAREEDLDFVVNTASRYSPWAAGTSAFGYITAPGGHRIGLCGDCVVKNGEMTGFRSISSLCLRVARDFPGISQGIRLNMGSLLILGPPGSGKTTLLRDLIRRISDERSIAVVDERGELFPQQAGYPKGKRIDVLTGCTKEHGIDMALRTMGPAWIAVDEITSEKDCAALMKAGWCGVQLIATAHAAKATDLLCRQVYRPLAQSKLFENLVVMGADKSWCTERMRL